MKPGASGPGGSVTRMGGRRDSRSALAMVAAASAGVGALCRHLNFCVFGREAPDLMFCLDRQEVGRGPGQCVVTCPRIPLPLLRGVLTSSKVSSALCVQLSEAALQEPAVADSGLKPWGRSLHLRWHRQEGGLLGSKGGRMQSGFQGTPSVQDPSHPPTPTFHPGALQTKAGCAA